MMKKSRFCLATLCFLLGCTLEPRYDAPCVALTDQWKNQQAKTDTPQFENWWDVFEDPQLAEYIQCAIENNQDLIAASERVEQARDAAYIARSKLFPWFSIPAAYSNQRELTQLYGPDLPYTPYVSKEHQLEYALPLMMNYEIDLWGKIRSSYKSASLNADARQEAYNSALLIVTTELANAYFQARINDALACIYEALIETRTSALSIQASRYEGDLQDYTEVAIADQDLSQVEARYFEVKQRRAIYENMIAVLLGTNPSEFTMEANPLTLLPPTIPQGVPCEALLRRPDLAEQQRRMESIHALLGVAYAEFFPTVDVQGGLGWVSPLSKYFFKSLSYFWMIGSNITELVFDGLARNYKVKLTWSQFREAVANYRQGVLNAFQEVENALSNLAWIDQELERLGNAVVASEIDTKIATDRYHFGVDSYLLVADKERRELDNEAIYLTMMGFAYTNTVQLIRALGGGW